MPTVPPLRRRLYVSLCALTRTTNRAARRRGVKVFLPALFTLRYSNMGGIEPDLFSSELDDAKSFTEEDWCDYWDRIAFSHLDVAQTQLNSLGGGASANLHTLVSAAAPAKAEGLAAFLAPGAGVMADHGPQKSHADIAALAEHVAIDDASLDLATVTGAAIALDEIVKAMTYFQVSAFPGTSPRRLQAYWQSRHLFEAIVPTFREGLGLTIEAFSVPAGGETVEGFAFFPSTPGPHPVVIATNGLEGTFQELLIPSLRHRERGLAAFMMEMPGTYAYKNPMSTASEDYFHNVIKSVGEDDRVDETRIGFLGVSFGGYWAMRLAANSTAIQASVACGAPTHLSFKAGPGMSEIILEALGKVLGANNPVALLRATSRLSINDLYSQIDVPILAINGDTDTLMSTQDTIDIAETAPRGELKLYADDDHCAMGHYDEWLDLAQEWLGSALGDGTGS